MTSYTRRRGLRMLAGAALAVVLGPSPYPGRSRAQTSDTDPGIEPATPWLVLPETAVLERIAFGSCLDQVKPQPIWAAVMAARPQLMLMLGDNVYGDVASPDLRRLRAAYALQAVQPELAAARAEIPFLPIWDDHDYGLNDGGGEFGYRHTTNRLFHAFWQRPQPGHPDGGIYYSRLFGPVGRRVQIIMLDTRSFRSPLRPKPPGFPYWGRYAPDPDPAKTMLGETQWAWLEAELRRPADLRLVVSSVQVLAEGHGFERWGNLPRERERLLDVIGRTQARGVVLLSGDRHSGAIYRSEAAGSYPLVEITSSSLNKSYGPSRDARIPPLVSRIYHPENFATVDIDWVSRRIVLTLRDVGGLSVAAVAVPFSGSGAPD
ncbi:MAG: alkaline phosphatase family protein [Hyphomicrobiaceae bacterium]|nr:alkaline phosphatase family protein [Hyphomicrobiaceae bacterium]